MTEDDDDLTVIAPIIRHTNVWYSRRKMEVIVILYVSSRKVEVPTLIDSGAARVFIDNDFVKKLDLLTESLPVNIEVYNMDGTINRNGSIMKKVVADLELKGKCLKEEFLVTALGRQRIILGYPWLKQANPKINWMKKEFSWWDEGPNRINIYTLVREAIEGDVYETAQDLVISYLRSEIREIDDAWIKEQYGEPVEISTTTVESPSQTLLINGFKTK